MRPTISPNAALLAGLIVLAPWRAIAAQDLLPLVGGSGGTAFAQVCPAGYVLTGIRARRGLTLDAIGIRCRPVRADGTLGAEVDDGPVWGGPGGTPFAESCQTGYVIVQQIALFNGLYISDLTYRCYRWIPASRRWNPDVAGVSIVVLGSSLVGSTGMCPFTARPADGVRGRSGSVVDAIGIRCDTP
jgi:hypothetical protein